MTPATPGKLSHQYATFMVDRHYLGVDVLDVQEVLRGQSLTRVPLASNVVEGLINLRGQIVPALDMRRMLHLEPRATDDLPVSVVVRSSHGAISLQVDEIDDVIEVDPGTFESTPSNVDAGMRTLFSGVHKLNGRLLLVLDTQRAVAAEST
jgi:purine-binding chemotaxis protein CheW